MLLSSWKLWVQHRMDKLLNIEAPSPGSPCPARVWTWAPSCTWAYLVKSQTARGLPEITLLLLLTKNAIRWFTFLCNPMQWLENLFVVFFFPLMQQPTTPALDVRKKCQLFMWKWVSQPYVNIRGSSEHDRDLSEGNMKWALIWSQILLPGRRAACCQVP